MESVKDINQGKRYSCLLCKETANLKTETQKGFQEFDLYRIYHCPHCNTSFSLPRPNTNAIYQLIYEKGNKIPGYNRYWKYYNEIKYQKNPIEYLANSESAYWALIHALKRTLKVPKQANILEIGSGLGYMTYALRKDGYSNAIGLDIAQKAVDKASEEFGRFYICSDAYKYAKETSLKYDIIFMTEVIEHIENPVELIRALISLLNNDGTLVITTPDKSIYPDHVIWATDKPPVHCWWFSDKSLKYLAKYFKMEVSFVDFTEYYINHNRELINMKLIDPLFNRYVFDKDNQLIETKSIKDLKSFYVLPDWIKNTYLYRKLSPVIYPMLMKSIKRVDRNKSNTICALFTYENSKID
jgi:2-polyprenyl-3-methyl-5-hydroxy-6-metoxy-1,4-benzoquinol methylase